MNEKPVIKVKRMRLDELAVERNVLAVERNDLAIERNELSNERTVLAYARTSIMSFITGMTLFKVYPHSLPMKVAGWVAIVVSGVLVVIGSASFIRRYRALARAHEKRKISRSPY